jgi:triosephosphate isomerase
MARKPIIAGNWKLNNTIEESKSLVEDIKIKLMDLSAEAMPEVVVCPVFTALSAVSEIVRNTNISLGAQNCSSKDSGAYTGEVSLPMLMEVGVSYVVIGHSERREYFFETDEMINEKAKAILAKGLIPIICCGETLEQREQGVTDTHIEKQIRKALEGISSEDVAKSVIAYEPIWAIGTGKTCDSVEANRVIKMIRDVVADVAGQNSADQTRILYGGSVKPDTIEEQMAQSDIDGALVGGASLKADSFAGIVTGCMKVLA